MSQHAFNCIDIVTSLMASRIVTSLHKDKQYRYFEQGIQCLIKTDKTTPEYINKTVGDMADAFLSCIVPEMAELKEDIKQSLLYGVRHDTEVRLTFMKTLRELNTPVEKMADKYEEMCTVTANKVFEHIFHEAVGKMWSDVLNRTKGKYGLMLLGVVEGKKS